jgi:heat shock protein beta
MLAKKTLELNPHHPVIKEMLNKVKSISISPNEDIEEEVREYADLLFNMALLNSGFLIENPTDFTEPMQKLLKLGFGLRKDAPIEEIEIDVSTLEEEEDAREEPEVEGEIEEEPIEDNTSEERGSNNHKDDL